MAPLRRYLRITRHSVIEVRIYLDRPVDADAWLLKRDDPALPRVIKAVQPLVLPKLREENERGKGRGSAKAKKKGVKDVIVQDDFEVSIFLTELSSRHSVLTKQKIFKDKARIQSKPGKLTGWLTPGTSDQPVVINEDAAEPIAIRHEDDSGTVNLFDIPDAKTAKKQHSEACDSETSDPFVSEQASITDNTAQDQEEGRGGGETKKAGLRTCYDGFSIYGRILCLVVKRRGARNAAPASGAASGSQAMLENWISTQATAGRQGEDDEAP